MHSITQDRKTADDIAVLRQAGTLTGDQLLRGQMKLKCYWNVTFYCITPLRFNGSKYDWEKLMLCLSGHPNSSQMSYDLQQETIEAFSEKLPNTMGMDVIECLVDVVTSFHLMNHFDKFLALVIFIMFFVVITLLALKCMPIYLYVRQLDRQKAIFTV